jgi:hypothetical protein
LTRRREVYHDLAMERRDADADQGNGAPSIHDIEDAVRLDELPPVDIDDRAITVDRILPHTVDDEAYARGDYQPAYSWARRAAEVVVERTESAIIVRCSFEHFTKELRFATTGTVRIDYRWDPSVADGDALFASELSLAGPLELCAAPEAEIWRFDIETVAKSERGLDRTRQGESVTLRWPIRLGTASVELKP